MKKTIKKASFLLAMGGSMLLTSQLNAQSFNIYQFAGNGTAGYSGDKGAAVSAEINAPAQIAVDAAGNVYFADETNNRVRMINTAGIISTIVGTGGTGLIVNGNPATTELIAKPAGVALDASGNLYVADAGDNRVGKVNLSTGVYTIFAGNGTAGFSGDKGAASVAELNMPSRLAVDGLGNVYISDFNNQRVRMVNTSGIISTFAGNGTAANTGDDGAATAAEIYYPLGIACDVSNNIYVACGTSVRKINTSGTISTLLSTSPYPLSDLALDKSSTLYLTETFNYMVYKYASGKLYATAGTGTLGTTTFGGAATSTDISDPVGVATSGSIVYFGQSYGSGGNNDICLLQAPLTGTIEQTLRRTCPGNATLEAVPSGGVSPYTYEWTYNGSNVASTQSIAATPNTTYDYVVTITDSKGNMVSAQTKATCLNLPPVQAAMEMGISNNITFYPNPSNGVFSAQGLEDGNVVEIYGILGNKIKTINISGATYTTSIDVTGLAKGLYIARVIDAQGNVISESKLIKQ